MIIPLSIILLAVFFTRSECVTWYIEPNSQQCFKESVRGNALVSGEYEVLEVPGQVVDFEVRNSKGRIITRKQEIPQGKIMNYSFISEIFDSPFKICFTSHVPNYYAMSCFGGRDEQIYLLEVTVERLKLAARLYSEEFSSCVPTIKIKFVDLGAFEVARRCPCPAEDGTESTAYDENEGLIYRCGASCLFVKKPRDLVALMKSQPLRIGVFRGEETFPLAEASLPLLGCLCDQVAMAGNDEQHRPKPYELAGSYCMRDPGEAPAGSISILLRLTLFGSSIVSYYQLYEESCVFKNNYDGELRVTRVIGDSGDSKSDTFTTKEGTVLATIGGDKPQKNDAVKK